MRSPPPPPTDRRLGAGNPPFRQLTPSTPSNQSAAKGGAIYIGSKCSMHLQDATFSGNSAPKHPRAPSWVYASGPNVYHVGECNGKFGIIYVYPGCNIAASQSGTEEK